MSDDLENIKKRLDNIEAQPEKAKFPYAEALKSTPQKDNTTPTKPINKYTKPSSSHSNTLNQSSSHTDVKKNILTEAKKIIGISPITKSYLNHVANTD